MSYSDDYQKAMPLINSEFFYNPFVRQSLVHLNGGDIYDCRSSKWNKDAMSYGLTIRSFHLKDAIPFMGVYVN